MNEQVCVRVVGKRNDVVQAFAGPVLAQHFFFSDQNDLMAVALTLADEINTLEISRQTNDVHVEAQKNLKLVKYLFENYNALLTQGHLLMYAAHHQVPAGSGCQLQLPIQS